MPKLTKRGRGKPRLTKLQCPLCKLIFYRGRLDVERSITKRGYRTYCEKTDKSCFAKEIPITESKIKEALK
jgi:hypothetical protein